MFIAIVEALIVSFKSFCLGGIISYGSGRGTVKLGKILSFSIPFEKV
jgi:hypothetical protein